MSDHIIRKPEFVETEEEYDALTEGAVVASGGASWMKLNGGWIGCNSTTNLSGSELAGTRCTVVRKGWDDES